MNNINSRSTIEGKDLLSDKASEQDKRNRKGLIAWWYQLTAQPEAPANATFAQREAMRKSHLLSIITFWLIFNFILFIPGCFIAPNHYVIFADLGMIIVWLIALLFNRAGKP